MAKYPERQGLKHGEAWGVGPPALVSAPFHPPPCVTRAQRREDRRLSVDKFDEDEDNVSGACRRLALRKNGAQRPAFPSRWRKKTNPKTPFRN